MPHRCKKLISLILCILFLLEQTGLAQTVSLNLSHYLNQAPKPAVPDTFRPLHLRYLSYDNSSNNFQLLLDKGSAKNPENSTIIEDTTKELLKYFFIGLSLPNDKFWVNLRPDSPNDILDPDLEKTDVGRIFLEADLQLKKDTAQFTSPQTPEGKAYWDKLYQKAGELFGTENITIPTLTRPWIVPDEVIIRESPEGAYIYKATLKVMLEEDYLKSSQPSEPNYQPLTSNYNFSDPRLKELNQYSTQLIKETIIPKLTHQINTSKRYAPLRQVYYSLILAQWFKARYRSQMTENREQRTEKANNYLSLIDSGNLTNLTASQPYDKQTYFEQYQKSFAEGEYNLQEPVHTLMGQSIRRYMSGGIKIVSSPFIIKSPNPGILETDHSISITMGGGLKIGQRMAASSIADQRREIMKTIFKQLKNLKNEDEEYRLVVDSDRRQEMTIYKGNDPVIHLDEYLGVISVQTKYLNLVEKCVKESGQDYSTKRLGILDWPYSREVEIVPPGGYLNTGNRLSILETVEKKNPGAIDKIPKPLLISFLKILEAGVYYSDIGFLLAKISSLSDFKERVYIIESLARILIQAEIKDVGPVLNQIASADNLKQIAEEIKQAAKLLEEKRQLIEELEKAAEKAKQKGEFSPSIFAIKGHLDGSGFVFSDVNGQTYILTNTHVLGSRLTCSIKDPDVDQPKDKLDVVLRNKYSMPTSGDLAVLTPIGESKRGFNKLEILTKVSNGTMAVLVSGDNDTISGGILVNIGNNRVLLLGAHAIEGDSGAPILVKTENGWVVAAVATLKGTIGELVTVGVITGMVNELSRGPNGESDFNVPYGITEKVRNGLNEALNIIMVGGKGDSEGFVKPPQNMPSDPQKRYKIMQAGENNNAPKTYPIKPPLKPPPYEFREEQQSSSSVAVSINKPGGIDLSRINKSIRAESVSSSASGGLNSLVDVDFNVNDELIQLQKLLNAQIVPSADRLNRYARAARASFASSPESADSAISLVAETFRLQEEKAVSAPAELKTLAAWLEQAG